MKTDIAIVGGGLSGLTAATFLARAGKQVTVYEKSKAVGGRARTESKQGFAFNQGPHALYRQGNAAQILRELGVEFHGKVVDGSGAFAIAHGQKQTLPGGFVSLLSTGLLTLSEKMEAARLLSSIGNIKVQEFMNLTVQEWLEKEIRHPAVRQLTQALFRVSTYAHDPERQSAGAAIKQFQMALSGSVYYLDDGWQTLVAGLRQAAEAAGATIQTASSVTTIEHEQKQFKLRLANGEQLFAPEVIIAASPAIALELVKVSQLTVLAKWAQAAIPVPAACLDVALASLPDARARFALGIDEPLYFSVHSATAKLAPDNGALIHVAKYLGADSAINAKAIEAQLEQLLDLLQPGWREVLIERRFLPKMTVSNALTTAANGGLSGRPGPAVPGIAGLYVIGDWVGGEGELADASLASAKAAAELIVAAKVHQASGSRTNK